MKDIRALRFSVGLGCFVQSPDRTVWQARLSPCSEASAYSVTQQPFRGHPGPPDPGDGGREVPQSAVCELDTGKLE